jgi:acetyltransferase
MPLPGMGDAAPPRFRPRKIGLPDGREVTLRAIDESDAPEIAQAFDRLSDASRYFRFMQHKKALDPAALARIVHPRAGREFAFVATIPAVDGFDIVGAAQYARADDADGRACEFGITVAEDWRRSGLGTKLLASLVRRARRDGYRTMYGLVIAENAAMLALARDLRFTAQRMPGDATVVRVQRTL